MNYASYLLEAKRAIRLLENALEDKKYKEAHEHVLNAIAELRMLSHVIREKKNER
jgi:hypothetical protein